MQKKSKKGKCVKTRGANLIKTPIKYPVVLHGVGVSCVNALSVFEGMATVRVKFEQDSQNEAAVK